MTTSLKFEDVKWLHVELTTKCNAWCPACRRNTNGFGLREGLKLQDLKLDRLSSVLSYLINCEIIQICGNAGDPIAANNFMKVLNFLVEGKYDIRIHTNGGLKTVDWWKNVGTLIKDNKHEIIFGIDGSTQEIHQIHRQGTNLKKILDNAQAFIEAGGNAVWQFIPYAFNEHQIIECIKISQSMKFKRFEFVKQPRVIDNARHYKTGEKIEFRNWKDFDKLQSKFNKPSCMHLDIPSLYLSAAGILAPCCYMYDVTYNEQMISLDNLVNNPQDVCKQSCGW